ncbi:glycoside hydrolase family 20 protein [Cucurbitaria berberidis CBS 394.84]|uniref:beta-N-acetylhexosaminidase n=1 Tax=Cucurbitaria berberidis CBS 394.84 TaxID=1168544 RepID=A0A9P4LAR8_9PLEO|nr:glycoside hydrolase family 20 protein [Cucurbitaria berberidis CBS 394.84]KAF1847793.1 glycoside hydrolase family 20 protein [Cucurbitaria berberidis CBS 394.84]
MALRFFSILICIVSALQPLPPVQWVGSNSTNSGFSLSKASREIYIDRSFGNVRDTEGLTLIPPTAHEFAETFRSDISALFGGDWTLVQVDELPSTGILLGRFRGSGDQIIYENGRVTEEGYEIEVTDGRVYIGGVGARGLFWGTRTLLQELLISNGSVSPGRAVDTPAYATRGYMVGLRGTMCIPFFAGFAYLIIGRKWYAPDLLKELCTYASFFKISEFHYHSSDNYPLNRGHNDTWSEVFSHFSLYPEENTELQGLIQRRNETLSRADFEGLQTHCAQRGVTIVPEIEAPGHALAITKWKPELALVKKDLLNLSHPDAIPTVKAIWAEFLPWFQTKEVHIGADEYDSELADDYINFVNEMATFINTTSAKRIRIWGTHEPSVNLEVSKEIIVQHCLINSEDWWAYMSLKNDHMPILPARYPQFYNVTRTMNFANVPGLQWDPSLFNPINTTEQLQPGASGNKGAILAAWNDNGQDSTTQLEAYYAMREGIPVMAARSWAGKRGAKIKVEELAESIALLASKAPGQNLDRRLPFSQQPSQNSPLLSWTRKSLDPTSTLLSKGSYGPPYTLTLNVSSPFTLWGPDTSLSLVANISFSSPNTTTLIFTTADNFPYPLRSVSKHDGHDPGHPGRIWTNQSTSSHEPVTISLPATLRIETDVGNGSRVWVNEEFAGRFEVFVFGGRNTLFSWSQMALVTPLEKIEGGIDGLKLEEGVGSRLSQNGNDSYVGPPVENAAGKLVACRAGLVGLLFGLVAFI